MHFYDWFQINRGFHKHILFNYYKDISLDTFLTSVFMHELGHNLLGELDTSNQAIQGDQYYIHSRWPNCAMYQNITNEGKKESSCGRIYTYHIGLWYEMKREGVGNYLGTTINNPNHIKPNYVKEEGDN